MFASEGYLRKLSLQGRTKGTQTKSLTLKVKYGSVQPEGFQRAIADFVCSHCPLVASAEAKPLRNKQSSVEQKGKHQENSLIPPATLFPSPLP